MKLSVKKSTFFLLCIEILCFSTTVFSNDNTIALFNYPFLQTEDSSTFFNYSINDNQIEFICDGYWDVKVSSTLNFTFSENNPVSMSYNPFLFSQEVDLSVWFLLENKWYFEGVFIDKFEKNTIAFGYYGEKYLKHFRIGNRGITFPNLYEIDKLGGEATESPGIMAEFSGSNWQSNLLFRYDALESKSKTFYGSNEVSENSIPITNYQKGKYFILPSGISNKIKSIYVEDENGNFSDTQGRKYKKLSNAEFSILGTTSSIELNKSYSKTIIAEFFSTTNGIEERNQVINKLGSISTMTVGESTGFLGEIEKYFGCKLNSSKPNLKEYMNIKDDLSNFFTKLKNNNCECLILQDNSIFSPFVNASYYELSSRETEFVSLASKFSDTDVNDYGITIISNTENNLLPNVITTNKQNDQAQIYRINKTNIECENRYPFAAELPQIYLDNSTSLETSISKSADYIIKEKSFTKITTFFISSNAIPGSVKVYINNIIDNTVKFNSESGCITFTQLPLSTDKVHVIWQENSSNYENGLLSIAFGIKYDFNQNSFISSTLSSQFLAPWITTFGYDDISFPGFLTSTILYSYKSTNISFKNKLTTSYQIPNTTGLYKIESFDEGSTETQSLSKDKIKLTSTDILPSLNSYIEDFPILSSDTRTLSCYNTSIENVELNREEIVLSWTDLTDDSIDNFKWNAYSIKLGDLGSLLQDAQEFSITLKSNYYNVNNVSSIPEYDIYLQLGVNFSEGNSYENSSRIPTWKISKTHSTDTNPNFVLSSFVTDSSLNNEWQKITISLSEIDKAKFTTFFDARIIIVQHQTSTGKNITGSFSLADYYIPKSIYSCESEIYCSTYQTLNNCDINSNVKLFNQDQNNYAQVFNWIKNIGQEFSQVNFYKFIPRLDLSSYKYLNLCFYFDDISSLTDFTFTLENIIGCKATDVLSFTIPYSKLKQYSNSWHLIKIDLSSQKIFIDDKDTGILCSYNTLIEPTRIKISFSESTNNIFSLADNYTGEFLLDELYLSESISTINIQNDTSFTYQNKTSALKINNFSVLSNYLFSTSVSSYLDSIFENSYFDTSIKAGINICGIDFLTSGYENYSSSGLSAYNGSHIINTTPTNIILKHFSFLEEYSYLGNTSSSKNNHLSFSIPIKNYPITLNFNTKALTESVNIQQDYNSLISFSFPIFNTNFLSQINYTSKQKVLTDFDNTNYFDSWYYLSRQQFTMGIPDAYQRTQLLSFNETLVTNFLSFSPNIIVNNKTEYINTLSSSNKNSIEFITSLPIKINKNSLSLSWKKKTISKNINTTSIDYLSDSEYFYNTILTSSWFYSMFPIYDLCLSSDAFNQLLTTQNENTYSSIYSFNWAREISKRWYDLIIPSTLSIAGSRNITSDTLGNIQDKLEIKSTLGSTALNIFGSTSSSNLFKWYEQDEFINTVSCNINYSIIDSTFDTIIISGLSRNSIYFSKNNSLSLLTELQIEQDISWMLNNKLIWKRPGNFSFITDAIISLFPSLNDKKINLVRENFLSFNIGYDEEILQSYLINHSINILFGKYISTKFLFETGASISTSKVLLTNTLSITGKISF